MLKGEGRERPPLLLLPTLRPRALRPPLRRGEVREV